MASNTLPLCDCGTGTVVMRTSRTDRNPGRKFFCCPNSRKVVSIFLICIFCVLSRCGEHLCIFGMQGDNGCNFFQWVKDDPSTSTASNYIEDERNGCKLCNIRDTAAKEIASMAKVELMFQRCIICVLIAIIVVLVIGGWGPNL